MSTLKGAKDIPKLYLNRDDMDGKLALDKPNESYHDLNELVSRETEIAEPERLPSTHPLYILYTSGTTGAPKGVVRDHGGTAVALNYACKIAYNFCPNTKYFGAADVGWIVGHSVSVYGALIRGASSTFIEGKPVIPDAGIIWKTCERLDIDNIFLSPTLVRELIRVDN